jgi:hypothetical protein
MTSMITMRVKDRISNNYDCYKLEQPSK